MKSEDPKTLFAIRLRSGLAHQLWAIAKILFGLAAIVLALGAIQISMCTIPGTPWRKCVSGAAQRWRSP